MDDVLRLEWHLQRCDDDDLDAAVALLREKHSDRIERWVRRAISFVIRLKGALDRAGTPHLKSVE